MTGIAVATTSQLGADAAAQTAAAGGNAVDCALAAALLTMNTEPGVCALAGGAYITIWEPGSDPVTIDGNVAVPGKSNVSRQHSQDVSSVTMDYGGGITTLVGSGTVAVPGSLAAVETAWKRFGNARWADLLGPSIQATRDGFPLSSACHYYLGYSGRPVFGRSTDGYAALHESDVLRNAGAPIVVPHLADSLALIAAEGAGAFYSGELAAAMVAHVQENGGRLSAEDLQSYTAIVRPALQTNIGEWAIATNPLPAVGGVVLSAMLAAFAGETDKCWTPESTARLIAVQQACLNYRKQRLDLADDVDAVASELLAAAQSGTPPGRWASSSTVHTSAVDDAGLGCAITASSGYGSGEMPAGTGLWLNNCLGELELNRRGLDAGPPGARLPSNMAPSVARRKAQVLALGSPGADRITTAMHQFLVNALQFEMPLQDAVAQPRVHLDTSSDENCLAAEPGTLLPELTLPVKTFDTINMYFGGVGAASYHAETGFEVAADPRRAGGIGIFHE